MGQSLKATGGIIREQVRATLAGGMYLLKLTTPAAQKVLHFVVE